MSMKYWYDHYQYYRYIYQIYHHNIDRKGLPCLLLKNQIIIKPGYLNG